MTLEYDKTPVRGLVECQVEGNLANANDGFVSLGKHLKFLPVVRIAWLTVQSLG